MFKGKKIFFFGLGIFSLVGSIVFYVWPRVMITSLNYELESIKVQNTVLLQKHDLLKLEFEKIKKLERIEKIALKKNFSYPEKGQIVYIKRNH